MEAKKLRQIPKAIGQNKKSLLLPSKRVCMCRQERAGFHITCYEMGQWATQWGVNITPNRQHSKSQPWSVHEFEERDIKVICNIFCCFIFAQHLAHGVSTPERASYSHSNMTGKSSYMTILLPKVVLMALSHRFADIDSDWQYRTPGTPWTAFRNKKALLILHKHT